MHFILHNQNHEMQYFTLNRSNADNRNPMLLRKVKSPINTPTGFHCLFSHSITPDSKKNYANYHQQTFIDKFPSQAFTQSLTQRRIHVIVSLAKENSPALVVFMFHLNRDEFKMLFHSQSGSYHQLVKIERKRILFVHCLNLLKFKL